MFTSTTSSTIALLSLAASAWAAPSRRAPAVGSDEWKAQYPAPFKLAPPKPEWLNCLQGGNIPNLPLSVLDATGYPVYPAGTDMNAVCSWTRNACYAPSDVHTTTPGNYVVSFDDGPQPVSATLYNFLQQQKVAGTHYMIGSNIVTDPDGLLAAFKAGQHLGIHTWKHQFLSTLTNKEIVGEIGWTMQIIYDLTGTIPNSMRAPDGDMDNRVRAVIDQCFNDMTKVFWGSESDDWRLINGPQGDGSGTNQTTVTAGLTAAINKGPSNGLFTLHHEISAAQIATFTHTFPLALTAGFKPQNIPQLVGNGWYTNSKTGDNPSPAPNNDPVLYVMKLGIPNMSTGSIAPSSTSSASSSLASSSSSLSSRSLSSTNQTSSMRSSQSSGSSVTRSASSSSAASSSAAATSSSSASSAHSNKVALTAAVAAVAAFFAITV